MPKRKRISGATMAAAVRHAKRKRYSRQNTASKALKMAKQVKRLVNKTIENKQVNYNNTNLAITSSGVNDNQFLQCTQGTSDGTISGSASRVGNSVTLMRQQYRFNFVGTNPAVVGNDRWNQIRVIIAEATDGNQPLLLSDILQDSSYATHGGLVFASSYTTKTGTNRNYKIHMDKVFELNSTAKGSTKVISYLAKWGKTGKVVDFNGTSAVPTNHNMSIMFISDSGSIQHPFVSYSVRSTYKDA